MAQNRFVNRSAKGASGPQLGGFVLASLLLHGVVVGYFSGSLFSRQHRQVPPVYRVDLVNLPVAAPQAGRSDAPPVAKVARPTPQPPPAPQAQALPKPEPRAPLPPAKTSRGPAALPAESAGTTYQALQEKIAELGRKQEREELKERLARLSATDTRGQSANPVGTPEGAGQEVGAAFEPWIKEFLKKAWTLSRYQVARLDLEAGVQIKFDRHGALRDYRFVATSGDERFDRSVVQALLQLKQLPNPPGQEFDLTVTFNLKDLLGQ